LRFPNPLILLTAGIVIAAALTWVVPAGEFDRRSDPATGAKGALSGPEKHVLARTKGANTSVLP
jgi:uncharacterized ion transporter superfamily protein YfcC